MSHPLSPPRPATSSLPTSAPVGTIRQLERQPEFDPRVVSLAAMLISVAPHGRVHAQPIRLRGAGLDGQLREGDRVQLVAFTSTPSGLLVQRLHNLTRGCVVEVRPDRRVQIVAAAGGGMVLAALAVVAIGIASLFSLVDGARGGHPNRHPVPMQRHVTASQ